MGKRVDREGGVCFVGGCVGPEPHLPGFSQKKRVSNQSCGFGHQVQASHLQGQTMTSLGDARRNSTEWWESTVPHPRLPRADFRYGRVLFVSTTVDARRVESLPTRGTECKGLPNQRGLGGSVNMPPSTPPPVGGAVKNLYSRPQIKHFGRAFHPPSILGPIPHSPQTKSVPICR